MCEMLEAYKVLRVSWVALGGLLGLFGAKVLTDLKGSKIPAVGPSRNLQSSNPILESSWVGPIETLQLKHCKHGILHLHCSRTSTRSTPGGVGGLTL